MAGKKNESVESYFPLLCMKARDNTELGGEPFRFFICKEPGDLPGDTPFIVLATKVVPDEVDFGLLHRVAKAARKLSK